jgi:hypothetical protein
MIIFFFLHTTFPYSKHGCKVNQVFRICKNNYENFVQKQLISLNMQNEIIDTQNITIIFSD